jgi:putative peptide zinc metalloprotease protein
VLTNALRCNDLYRATWLTTKDRVWRLTPAEIAELDAIGTRDRRVARWFGLVYLAGSLVVGWTVFALIIPFLIGMLVWIQGNLADPNPATASFWESLGAAVAIVGQAAAPILLALRERRLRKLGGLR